MLVLELVPEKNQNHISVLHLGYSLVLQNIHTPHPVLDLPSVHLAAADPSLLDLVAHSLDVRFLGSVIKRSVESDWEYMKDEENVELVEGKEDMWGGRGACGSQGGIIRLRCYGRRVDIGIR